MLAPKKVKYRKRQKGRLKKFSSAATSVDFGEWGLKTLVSQYISAKQIEACRIALARSVRKGGKFWIRIFPDKPVSKKPAETRMGKGKGPVEGWVAPAPAGRVLFEIEGIPESEVKKVFNTISHKIGGRTKIVARV